MLLCKVLWNLYLHKYFLGIMKGKIVSCSELGLIDIYEFYALPRDKRDAILSRVFFVHRWLGSLWGKPAMFYGACTSWPKGLGLGHLLSPLTSIVVSPSDSILQFGDSDCLFLTGFSENRSRVSGAYTANLEILLPASQATAVGNLG